MDTASISPPEAGAEVTVPVTVARRLAGACTESMDGHLWASANIAAARAVLAAPEAAPVLAALAALLSRAADTARGWAVLQFPADLSDEQLRLAGAGMLAGIGRPFFSINDRGRLWIGDESTPGKDASSFGGTGRQGVHIDAPNVERVPDFTSLLILRPDPAGGGYSLVGDLHGALACLAPADQAELGEEAYFEGRAEGLHGTGATRMPFPVLDPAGAGRLWVRWAAKMVSDPRNRGHAAVLQRFAAALEARTCQLPLSRGALLILDQQRAAHGRTALGDQSGHPDGTRRLLLQAKAADDPAAPAWHLPQTGGGAR